VSEKVGIIQVPSGSAEIRDQWLQDVRLAAIDTGVAEPPIEPGSDWYLQGEANGQLALVGLANISISAKGMSVLDAEGDDLDAIREGDGLPVVSPIGSTGKIRVSVAGPTTIGANTQLKLPNGLRIKTTTATVNPADQAEIDVSAIDVGSLTNLKGGSAVTFVVAPTNVNRTATVSNDFPLTGGTDAETDARKRDRILNTRRNKPAGGNWAYWRQLALDNFASVVDCYVYCAPGGPSSKVVVPMRGFDRANNSYTRAPSAALVEAIRSLIWSDSDGSIETVTRASVDEPVDFTLKVKIPDSSLAGGNGQGWTNSSVWPTLEVSDGGRVMISSVTDNDTIQIGADTATPPVAGQTEIAWWSPADRLFYSALVVSVGGSTGAWDVELDRPLVGIDGVGPSVGDFISPNAQNLTKYGETWVAMMEALGPGELIESPDDRLPRALRNPHAADEDPYDVTNASLQVVTGKHPEVTNISYGYAPQTEPTIPSSVDDPPNVLVPRHFACYPI
jgi:hypothetical protein